jgi:hypothetical protein
LGKFSTTCENCNNQIEVIINDKKNELEKVKGVANYYPLMKEIGDQTWDYGYYLGLTAICKCGTPTYIIGSMTGTALNPPETATKLPEGYLTPGFCPACSRAFVANSPTCPYCARKKGGE